MPLLRLNATPEGLTLHDTPQPATRRLCTMSTQPGPTIIMVHGYKYRPGDRQHCPHRKIFGPGAMAWPAQLQFGRQQYGEGLGIAFGWDARGPLYRVHRRATALGERLAATIALLRSYAPERPVHVIAHSLGAEMALSALAHLPALSIDRMILLTGASYALRAGNLLGTAAGKSVEVLNITSRENDLFDAAFERLVPATLPRDRAIGRGIDAGNAATVQLDCPVTLAGLRSLGQEIAAPSRRICHWSAYTRPGAMALYARFLRDPHSLPLEQLSRLLPPRSAPRWSRFWPQGLARHAGHEQSLPLRDVAIGSAAHGTRHACAGRHNNEPAY